MRPKARKNLILSFFSGFFSPKSCAFWPIVQNWLPAQLDNHFYYFSTHLRRTHTQEHCNNSKFDHCRATHIPQVTVKSKFLKKCKKIYPFFVCWDTYPICSSNQDINTKQLWWAFQTCIFQSKETIDFFTFCRFIGRFWSIQYFV